MKIFTFEFSEKVEGFEPKDITIAKGGNRLDDTFKAEIPGLKYSIDVKTSAEIGTEEELIANKSKSISPLSTYSLYLFSNESISG